MNCISHRATDTDLFPEASYDLPYSASDWLVFVAKNGKNKSIAFTFLLSEHKWKYPLYVLSAFCTMQLSPENAEEYIDYLRSVGRLDEAAVRLAAVVNDESFVSKEGKSNYQVRFYTHLKHL